MDEELYTKEAFEHLNAALTRAVQKNRKSLNLLKELLSRAKIKAASSDTQKVRQAAAISVLERMLSQFESNE